MRTAPRRCPNGLIRRTKPLTGLFRLSTNALARKRGVRGILSSMASQPIDLRTAKVEDLKSRDLTPATIERARKPRNTWFVQRTGDPKMGEIIAVEEKEAWDIRNNRSEWKRKDFKFIGFSDGKTYMNFIDAAMGKARELEPAIESARAEAEKYRNLETKLMLDEVVDMEGDPTDLTNEENKKKVLRIRTIISKQEDKLEKLEVEFRSVTSEVARGAFNAELKIAIANWKKQRIYPGAMNMITPHVNSGERVRILGAMGQQGMQ